MLMFTLFPGAALSGNLRFGHSLLSHFGHLPAGMVIFPWYLWFFCLSSWSEFVYHLWSILITNFNSRNWFVRWVTGNSDNANEPYIDYDDDDDDDKEKEEKKSIKERLQAIQEVSQTVQNTIGYIASLAESTKKFVSFVFFFISY